MTFQSLRIVRIEDTSFMDETYQPSTHEVEVELVIFGGSYDFKIGIAATSFDDAAEKAMQKIADDISCLHDLLEKRDQAAVLVQAKTAPATVIG